MRVVAVYAAVRKQAHQMQGGAIFTAVFNGCCKRLVFRKAALLHRLGNAGQLLINNTSRTDIRMTDLRIAHLSVRQSDVHPGRADLCLRPSCKQPVDIRFICCMNRIAVVAFVNTEAIHNDEDQRFFHKGTYLLVGIKFFRTGSSGAAYLLAASTIAAKSGAFKDAPPIRPPSTSSLAKISAAFEGLHEPP